MAISKSKILWADDDPDDLMLMRQVLEDTDKDFEVVDVPNGRAALDYLEKARNHNNYPCLVILDMNMPVLNGRETLAIMKSQDEFKDLPTVVFTTSSSEIDKLFCRRFNVEMITKPPSYSNLKEVVQNILTLCKK